MSVGTGSNGVERRSEVVAIISATHEAHSGQLAR